MPRWWYSFNIIIRPLKKTPEQSPGAFTNKQEKANYFLDESIIFLVVSIIFLVLSIMTFVESEPIVFMVSVFTTVESVVVVDEPDPQAANVVIANTVNNFFIIMSLVLIPGFGKGNPVDQ